MTRLILLCGLPGAGKTTRVRALAAALPAIRLSPGEWLTGPYHTEREPGRGAAHHRPAVLDHSPPSTAAPRPSRSSAPA